MLLVSRSTIRPYGPRSMLVLEIIDATKIPVETAKSARLKRVAAIKALVGETFWASLTPHPRHFSTTRAN